MEQIRVTFVGGTSKFLGIGKTCFIKTYIEEKVCEEAEDDTIFKSYVNNVQYEGKQIELTIYDTAGLLDHHHIRKLSYPGTDVFLLAYSIGDHESFKNLSFTAPSIQEEGFFEEIQRHCPDTPIILIGLKEDLRNHEENQGYHQARPSEKLVSYSEGFELAKKLKCVAFFECSIYKPKVLKKVFNEAIKIALNDGAIFYKLQDTRADLVIQLLQANSSKEIFHVAEVLFTKYKEYQRKIQVKYQIA